MKLIEVTNLKAFYEAVKDQTLPLKTSYKLALLSRNIEQELNFYQTKFREIILEYCEMDENGNPLTTEDGAGIKLRAGTEMECTEKVRELQELEINFPETKFSIDEFEGVNLTIDQLKTGLVLFE